MSKKPDGKPDKRHPNEKEIRDYSGLGGFSLLIFIGIGIFMVVLLQMGILSSNDVDVVRAPFSRFGH